jgi:hypothetical protein
MKNLMLFESFSQSIDEAEKGLMHKLLNINPDEKITSKYTSGKKLASDLVAALKKYKTVPAGDVKKKAASMLAYAANWPSDGPNSVLDKALRSVKSINEKKDKPKEVVVPEELKAEGPNEKLFKGESIDRETAKKKAREQAKREGYEYETAKAQLKGVPDENGNLKSYTYSIVMSKELK